MAQPLIDLNCDMGESWYSNIIGQDEALMPFITSCNLACGVHGGDPATMKNAVRLAIRHGVNIGAHPSLPDHENFGRTTIDVPEMELNELIFSQVDRLLTVVKEQQGTLHHLKPHGALYHLAASRPKEALVVVAAAKYFQIPKVYGLPGSLLEKVAIHAGLAFVAEGFIDRVYENGQQLRSRQLPDSLIHDAEQAARQAYGLVVNKTVTDYYSKQHTLYVDTLCVHGDHKEALVQLLAVTKALSSNNQSFVRSC